MSNERKQAEKDGLIPFFIILTVVGCVWALSGYLIHSICGDSRGTFGDMFGAVNALFSGAAFAGIIFAILLQRRELQLQRSELELTRKELQRSAEAQEKSEAALAMQAKALSETAKLNSLALMPAITCQIDANDSQIVLSILNLSDLPGYDIDVILVAYYHEDELSPVDFVETHAPSYLEKHGHLTSNSEGFFGVFDRFCHFIVPRRRKVSMDVDLPVSPSGFYILAQFKDIQGFNYHQLYWFFERHSREVSKRYRLGNIQPSTPSQCARVEYDGSLKLVSVDGSELPMDVNNQFQDHWKSSIPANYLRDALVSPEDLGEWSDI